MWARNPSLARLHHLHLPRSASSCLLGTPRKHYLLLQLVSRMLHLACSDHVHYNSQWPARPGQASWASVVPTAGSRTLKLEVSAQISQVSRLLASTLGGPFSPARDPSALHSLTQVWPCPRQVSLSSAFLPRHPPLVGFTTTVRILWPVTWVKGSAFSFYSAPQAEPAWTISPAPGPSLRATRTGLCAWTLL